MSFERIFIRSERRDTARNLESAKYGKFDGPAEFHLYLLYIVRPDVG